MKCDSVIERLPWLLNGTLEMEESGSMREHLSGCAGCRAELERTGWVWEAHRSHLSPAVLVAHAEVRTVEEVSPSEIDAHLAVCDECTDSLRRLRSSHTALELDLAARAPQRAPLAGGWGRTALAASVAGLLGIAVWLGEESRIHSLQDENALLSQRLSDFESPQLNVLVAELSPDEAMRGGTNTLTELIVPATARSVTLLLLPSRKGAAEMNVTLIDPHGARIWSQPGLVPSDLGDFTLSLPASLLTEGRFTLELQAAAKPEVVERYSIRIRFQ